MKKLCEQHDGEIKLLKDKLFRIETIVWILAGINGLKLGVESIPVISAMIP
jgi:hypothetical protein